MKKFLLTFFLFLNAFFTLGAQEVCFWTNEYKTLPIRIYIDEQFAGEITAAYKDTPAYGDEGTLSVMLAPGQHKVAAVNAYGYEYDGWPGRLTPATDKVNFVKIRKNHFPSYSSVDYIVYDPYWYPLDYGPYYYYHHPHHHHDRGLFSSDDDSSSSLGGDEGELNEAYAIGLAITAVGAFISGAVSSISNWNYPDARFPYLAAGLKTEFLPGAGGIRNVARVKGRIGGYGGMSFIAEGGEAYYFRTGWEPTIAAGLGWAYGCFEVDFRYQIPAFFTPHQFASLDLGYDWFVTDHVCIDFGVGLALSGYEVWGNTPWDGVEVPVSIGIQYAF